MMKFALLASGSKGNCCLIKDDTAQIVIDCGSTKRYLTSCFEQLGCDYTASDALLITHTHSDHIAQLNMFKAIDTYACAHVETPNMNHVEPFDVIRLKSMNITILPMSHDCEGTVGFVIENEDSKLVYITDTGYIRDDVKGLIQNADTYIFESNHDIEMLMATSRPVYVKQRIINDYGHLCNDDSANVLTQVVGERTKEIVLAHISQEGNHPQLVLEAMQKQFAKKGLADRDISFHPAGQFDIHIGGSKK